MQSAEYVDQCETMYRDGYDKGLKDGLAGVVVASKTTKTERWRRLALACSGMAMALVIAVIVESVLLYFAKH